MAMYDGPLTEEERAKERANMLAADKTIKERLDPITGDVPVETLIAAPTTPAAAPVGVPFGSQNKNQIDTSTDPMDLYAMIQAATPSIKGMGEFKADEQGYQDFKEERESIKKALSELDKQKEGEEKEIAKRELYSTIAAQLGQLVAAGYGAKHNVDMSGIKVETPQFGKEYDRLMEKYKGKKQDVSATGELDIADKRGRSAYNQNELNARRAHDTARSAEAGTNTRFEQGLRASALMKDAELKNQKDIAGMKTGIDPALKAKVDALKADAALNAKVSNIFNDSKTKREDKLAALAALYPSITPAQWENIVTEKNGGFLWRDIDRPYTEIISGAKAAAGGAPTAPVTPPPIGTVMEKNGKNYKKGPDGLWKPVQ